MYLQLVPAPAFSFIGKDKSISKAFFFSGAGTGCCEPGSSNIPLVSNFKFQILKFEITDYPLLNYVICHRDCLRFFGAFIWKHCQDEFSINLFLLCTSRINRAVRAILSVLCL